MNTIDQNLQVIAQGLAIANKAGAFELADSATIAIALQQLTNQINELKPKEDGADTTEANS